MQPEPSDGASDVNGRPSWLDRLLSPFRTYVTLVRAFLADWLTDIGLVLNAFSIFALVVALFSVPLSQLLGDLLAFYRSLTSIIFDPIKTLFAIDFPDYVQDIVLVWTITGAIGARTVLWLNMKMFDEFERALARYESLSPAARAAVNRQKGADWLEREADWIRRQRDLSRIDGSRRIVMFLGALLTGPAFFITIMYFPTPVPGGRMTGRKVVLLQIVALLAALGVLFALNWASL